MSDIPDDLSRLIHETLEEIGWNADAESIARVVKRLDVGLPVEDEFAVTCAWLGKCDLLHKLDQHQMPKSSKTTYQVPDFLAKFSTQNNSGPLLIEVKSKSDNVLSFRPDYLAKLKNYSDLIGAPLLIAWKFHSVWLLFEARHLKKAKTNFNISFGEAMKENLLCMLAGDFAYSIGAGAGVHLRLKKNDLISTEVSDGKVTEEWHAQFAEVRYTDRDGEYVLSLSPEVQTLFATWDLELEEVHSDHEIWLRHTASDHGIQFAHTALVRLLDWRRPDGVKVSWRREARKEKLDTIQDFRGAVVKALNEKIVRHILDVVPKTYPEFIERDPRLPV